MSASSVISNLQQANRCAGKCNCCRDLQRQINQLKQQIANIPKSNEQAIINKAVKQAKDTITPLLPGIVTPIAIAAIVPKLQPLQVAQKVLKAELFATKKAAKLGLNLAKDASGKVITARNAAEFATKQAGRASTTASRAINVANSTGGKLATISRTATQASSTASRAFNVASSNGGKIASVSRTVLTANTKASQALFEVGNAALQAQAARATAKSALSRVVGIAGTVSGLAASVAVLKLSENRFDQVEKTTDRFNNDLTKAFSLIQKNRSGINQNAEGIKTNSKEIEQASDLALGARLEAKTANQTAKGATQTANKAQTTAKGATQTANKAQTTANTATQTAKGAQTSANTATAKAIQAQTSANTATAKAIQAQTSANTATAKAIQAQTSANTATAKAIQAQVSANTATAKAIQAQTSANTATAKAIQAQTSANTATQQATGNRTRIEALEREFAEVKPQVKLGLNLARDASGKVITANNAAKFAARNSRRAVRIAGNAARTAETKTKTITRTIGGGTSVDRETKAKLDKIDKKLDDLPKLFVARAATELGKPLTASQVQSASKAGTCQAMKSPECTNTLRNQVGNQINQATNRTNQLTNNLGRANLALGATQSAQLAAISNSVNAPITGSTPKEDCTLGTTTQTAYSGSGMYGLQSQINSVSKQLEEIGKIVCRTYRIMGGNTWYADGSTPKYKFNPEKSIKDKIKQAYKEPVTPSTDVITLDMEAKSLPELLFGLNSATWRRSGLYKLPVKAAPSIMPNITRNPVTGEITNIRDWLPVEYQNITDSLTFDAYRLGQMRSVVGEFPLSFSVDVEENGRIVEKQVRVDNIADAFSELMGLSLIIQDDLELNTQLGIKGLTETAATKNATLITQDLALANAKYLGYQMTRTNKKVKTLFTPGTSNIKEFLAESDQQIISYAHRSGHLEHKLNTLLISAGITKAALTSRANDAIPGSIIAKDALQQLQANEDDWKLFLKLLREPVGDLNIDGVPLMEVEDLTSKLKEYLRKLQ